MSKNPKPTSHLSFPTSQTRKKRHHTKQKIDNTAIWFLVATSTNHTSPATMTIPVAAVAAIRRGRQRPHCPPSHLDVHAMSLPDHLGVSFPIPNKIGTRHCPARRPRRLLYSPRSAPTTSCRPLHHARASPTPTRRLVLSFYPVSAFIPQLNSVYLQFMSNELVVHAHCPAHAGPDNLHPPPSNTPARRRRPNEGKCYVFNSVFF